MLCSIDRTNFNVCLILLFEISGNVSVLTACFPVYDVIKFEITLAFSSSRFPTWPKKSGQKFEYLKNEKSFYDKVKNLLHQRVFTEANKVDFLEGACSTLMAFHFVNIFWNLLKY